MTTNGVLRLPDHIHFGAGSRAGIAPSAVSFGQRVLVVADPYLLRAEVLLDTLAALAALGAESEVYSAVIPELPVASIERAAAAARVFRPDVVVGIGGGSALDLAKLVALLAVHDGPLAQYYGENRVPAATLPLIAVPTTAGTGSEVTPVAVVSDPERELKVGVSSPRLIPRIAIVDPTLTSGAPRTVAAYAGIDAYVHAVESYTARTATLDWTATLPVFVGRNLLSSVLGREAAVIIRKALPRVLNDPHDDAARELMSSGSLLAGMAFGSAGTHLSHALQYPIGAITHTPHGLGTGLLLPYVMQALVEPAQSQLAELADASGIPGTNAASKAQGMVDAIADLVARVGLPLSLREIGIEATQLPRIAELALTVARLANNSPTQADGELFHRILTAAFDGDRASLRTSTTTEGATQ